MPRRAVSIEPQRFAQYLEAVKRLDEFALRRYARNIVHLALRWVLDQSGVYIALWGARRPEQFAPLDGILGRTLDSEAMKSIDCILRETIEASLALDFLEPPVRKD